MPLFINGEFRESKTDKWIELTNPVSGGTVVVVLCCRHSATATALLTVNACCCVQATNDVIGLVPEATNSEVCAIPTTHPWP